MRRPTTTSPQRFSKGSAFRRARRPFIGACIAVAALTTVVVPIADAATADNPSSISELQAKRAAVRRQRASQAARVNALKATDQQVSGALSALDANVNAQQSRLEETERAVRQAESDQTAAEKAQTKALKELDQLKVDLRSSAVDAYVSMGSSAGMSSLGSGNINDTVNRRTLLSVQANSNIDLVERYRSVQEDLAIQKDAATSAAQRATRKKSEAKKRLADLDAAYKRQQAFAIAVDNRVNAALAEAQSLASIDSQLAGSISSRQSALARAVAAQQSAAAARNSRRRAAGLPVAQGRGGASSSDGGSSSSGGDSSSGSGSSGPPPAIVGAGSIVSVGGIRVSASIAGNLQALLSAASAAGINFSGGGYRDSAGQIAVRRANCGSSNYAIYQASASSCRPPTARPGSSMHERGLAIDFTQGGRTLTRGSSGYQWLRANGSRFGFFNLPAEAWHWSTNGN